MLKHQTHYKSPLCYNNKYTFISYNATTPNTLYMSQLYYTTKHIVHITVIPYHETHFICHHYVIKTNILYMSPLFYTIKHTLIITVMSCHQISTHVNIMLYHETHSTYHHYSITTTLYTPPLFYKTKQIYMSKFALPRYTL